MHIKGCLASLGKLDPIDADQRANARCAHLWPRSPRMRLGHISFGIEILKRRLRSLPCRAERAKAKVGVADDGVLCRRRRGHETKIEDAVRSSFSVGLLVVPTVAMPAHAVMRVDQPRSPARAIPVITGLTQSIAARFGHAGQHDPN
jgi:hypothetical protein